jgi:hypothetical protein
MTVKEGHKMKKSGKKPEKNMKALELEFNMGIQASGRLSPPILP